MLESETLRRHWFPKGYADIVAKLRVPASFVMVAAFAWFSHPTALTLAFGFPASLLGLALRAWAAGHLMKDKKLAVSGPYSFTRNPLYLGTLTAALGLAIASDSLGLGILFAAVFAVVYLPAIELEEQHLLKILPGYNHFAARVPLLIPRWPKVFGPDNFSWAQYRKNREYEAGFGWIAGAILLVCKAVWGL